MNFSEVVSPVGVPSGDVASFNTATMLQAGLLDVATLTALTEPGHPSISFNHEVSGGDFCRHVTTDQHRDPGAQEHRRTFHPVRDERRTVDSVLTRNVDAMGAAWTLKPGTAVSQCGLARSCW
jgi:hypothetical protein